MYSLPPAALSPNGRSHWRVKALATKTYKEECLLLSRLYLAKFGKPPGPVVVINYTFYVALFKRGSVMVRDGCYRPRDVDNAIASIKALQDSLVVSGMIDSDSAAHLQIGWVVIDRDTKAVPGVVVSFGPVAP